MDVCLEVIEGRPLGAVIELKPGRFTIGRDSHCQLRPRSPTVSQLHCALMLRDGELTVQDLGSSNGTLVNDQLLRPGEETRLAEGDRLQIGQLIFAIRSSDGSSEPHHAGDASQGSIGAGDDPNARTLLVSALGRFDHDAVEHRIEREQEPSLFAYRHYQAETAAVCLGINWVQTEDEAMIRSLRKALISELSHSRSRRIILDLRELETLPSLAAATVVAMAIRCRRAGGGVRLCGLQPGMRRMAAALKLSSVAGLYPGYEEALADPWG